MSLSLEKNEAISFRGQPQNSLMGGAITVLKIACFLK